MVKTIGRKTPFFLEEFIDPYCKLWIWLSSPGERRTSEISDGQEAKK